MDLNGDNIPNKDDWIYIVWTKISDELLYTLNDIAGDLADDLYEYMKRKGMPVGRVFTAKIYVQFTSRYFRITIKVKIIPGGWDFQRKQVDEINRRDYKKGIQKEQQRSANSDDAEAGFMDIN